LSKQAAPIAIMAIRRRFGVLSGENVGLCTISLLEFYKWGERGASLTNGDLFTEMEPVTPNVSLHHLPTQHVTIVTTVTFQKSLFLFSHRSVVRLVEAFSD
jgi:hypothetical protein